LTHHTPWRKTLIKPETSYCRLTTNIPCWHAVSSIASLIGSWHTYSNGHHNRSTFCAYQANFVHSTVLARPKRVQTRPRTHTPAGFSFPNHLEYFIKPLLTPRLHLVHSLHLRRDASLRGLFYLTYVCRANSGCGQKKYVLLWSPSQPICCYRIDGTDLTSSLELQHSRLAFPDLLVETFIRASADSGSFDHQSQ
jgi:hypothetical protein